MPRREWDMTFANFEPWLVWAIYCMAFCCAVRVESLHNKVDAMSRACIAWAEFEARIRIKEALDEEARREPF